MVAVQDLRGELVWDRIAVVVRQLHVRGVLSVPERLADQPVGTLNVYATQPRAWTPAEVQALGAFAIVTAELVGTAVELANNQVEVAQLRQALASRVWIEQARGWCGRHQGSPWMRGSASYGGGAWSSSRKLAAVAQEVVQEVQRARVAAKAPDDARVRAAEARPGGQEQALQAAQTGLARRQAALDRAQDVLDGRGAAAGERDHFADLRDQAADERNHLADARERAADVRDHAADHRDRDADLRDRAADYRDRDARRREARGRAADDPGVAWAAGGSSRNERAWQRPNGSPRRQVARQRRHQEAGPPHAPSAPLPAAVGPPATPPGYRGWAAGLVRSRR